MTSILGSYPIRFELVIKLKIAKALDQTIRREFSLRTEDMIG
jgi:hypothetical protein